MHEVQLTVEATLHCFDREDVFRIKQLWNVFQVCSSDFEQSVLNDCNEAAVHYVADQHRTPGLYFTAKVSQENRTLATETAVTLAHITRKGNQIKKTVRRRLKNLNFLQGGLEELEAPVRFSDTVIVAVEYLMAYDEAMRGSEMNEWKLSLKEELAGFHRKDQQLDPRFLAARKGCHSM